MKALAAVLTLTLATQANALSCLQSDIVQSYKSHAKAEESYVVVRGKFRFTPPPRQPVSNDAQPQTVKARFEGVALGKTAFNVSYSRPLSITFGCAGPWCGAVSPDTDAIAFVEQRGSKLHLDEGPCPWRVFYEPTKEQTDRLLLCHARGICD